MSIAERHSGLSCFPEQNVAAYLKFAKDNFSSQQYHLHPHGPTTRREGKKGQVHCVLGGSQKREPWGADPRLTKLATGTWNVTSLAGKEPELVR